MRTKLFFAALAALALASCNEAPLEAPVTYEMLELEVNVPVLQTRLTGAPSAEDAVSNLQIFVFDDASGTLEAYGNQNASSVKLKCLPGVKDIVALVNAPSFSGIATKAELLSKTSSLSDNAKGDLVMSGLLEDETLSATSKTVTVDVSRIAAKVTLLGVTNAMDLVANQKKEFKVTGVYLINVAGDRAYLTDSAPSKWYHKMRYEASNTLSFLYDAPETVIAHGSSYSASHHFYCYPNLTDTDANNGMWSARKTRLVVEATLGGETCYYPVTLDEVAQNTAYTVTLTVTRPGSSSPDEPISTSDATFTVQVKDWIDGADYTEII